MQMSYQKRRPMNGTLAMSGKFFQSRLPDAPDMVRIMDAAFLIFQSIEPIAITGRDVIGR